MLEETGSEGANSPTTTALSSAPTIQPTMGPAATRGPTPGMTNKAEPNNKLQTHPQNAPKPPQYFMRSPVL